MQAFMAVLEGYAEHVMDAVGAQILPNLPELRGAMDRRRRDRSGLLRIFEKLIGMDMKLRQYELGKKFCDAVAAGRRDRRAQPRVGGAGPDADARRARRPGRLAGPHGPRARRLNRALETSLQPAMVLLRSAEHAFALSRSRDRFSALSGDFRDQRCNKVPAGVYKHVFAGYTSPNGLRTNIVIREATERG